MLGKGEFAMVDRIDDAWTVLRSCLEVRSRELSDDVRTYPTPIARCDEQKAIEERDAAIRQLRMASELETGRSTFARDEWVARLRAFAESIEKTDDATVAACQQLVAALGR